MLHELWPSSSGDPDPVADKEHHVHHLPRGGRFAAPDIARILRAAVIASVLLIVLGAVLLWPSGGRTADPLGLDADPLDAHVSTVEELPCTAESSITCAVVSFEVTSGPDAGTGGSIEQAVETPINAGDDIQVTADVLADGSTLWAFYDFQRSTPLLVLLVLFAAVVIALGRWRGLGALAGLAASLLVIVWFALPSLVDGNIAIAVALVTAGAVAILALYLAHGIGPATDVALLSTFASLALTGALS